jgi:hypothetical protein
MNASRLRTSSQRSLEFTSPPLTRKSVFMTPNVSPPRTSSSSLVSSTSVSSNSESKEKKERKPRAKKNKEVEIRTCRVCGLKGYAKPKEGALRPIDNQEKVIGFYLTKTNICISCSNKPSKSEKDEESYTTKGQDGEEHSKPSKLNYAQVNAVFTDLRNTNNELMERIEKLEANQKSSIIHDELIERIKNLESNEKQSKDEIQRLTSNEQIFIEDNKYFHDEIRDLKDVTYRNGKVEAHLAILEGLKLEQMKNSLFEKIREWTMETFVLKPKSKKP